MDSDFKAFIAALIATPFAFAFVAFIEKVGVFPFSKYGALQFIGFLVSGTYVFAQNFFKNSDVESPVAATKDECPTNESNGVIQDDESEKVASPPNQ